MKHLSPLEKARKIIKEEDPRVVEALMASILSRNEDLEKRIKIAEDKKEKEQQDSLDIEIQIKVLRRKLFGRSKEDRFEASDRKRDTSQIESSLFSKSAFPSPEVRSKNPKDNKLDEKTIYHYISDEDLENESKSRGLFNPSADQWEQIEDLFDVSTKITIVERSYEKEVHKRAKYKLKKEFALNFEKEVILTAEADKSLLPGMQYSTDIVASVVADKYVNHLPLERQTRMMESVGLSGMKTSTLSRFCALAASSLEPIQDRILEELKTSDLGLHLDETPWKIQKKDEKNGYMWVISNKYGSYYFFEPTRSGKVIRDKLENYSGSVLTDGYGGYNTLDQPELDISQGYCWAHARRYFLPLEDKDNGVKDILDKIDELFRIEREAKSFEDLKILRSKKSKAVIKDLHGLLIKNYQTSRVGSLKRKSIEYLTKRWKGFTLFLEDMKLPLSNNEAERTIRHAVVGRKNYYGSQNHNGAKTAATLFSVIESCKKNDIDPKSYLHKALSFIALGKTPLTPLQTAKNRAQ